MSREQMAFNRTEAAKNRDFQETMSRNAYRYGMEDMRKAGLNPMLAFSQGGASTPGGSQASGGGAPRVENEIAPAVSSAMDALRFKNQVEEVQSQIETQESQQEVNREAAKREKAQAELNTNSAKKVIAEKRALDATIPAIQAKSRADVLKSKYDEQNAALDAVTSRAGVAAPIVDKVLRWLAPPSDMKGHRYSKEEKQVIKEHRELKKAGRKGIRVP